MALDFVIIGAIEFTTNRLILYGLMNRYLEKCMKKATKVKIKSFFKKVVPIIATIVPGLFIAIKTIFNFYYKIRCKSFYGINLDCFKLDNNYIQQVVTVLAIIFLILGSLFAFSKLINKNKFVFIAVYSLINGTVLFFLNMLMFVLIFEYNVDKALTNLLSYFNTHAILTIILYFLLSYGLSFILSVFVLVINNKIKLKKEKNIIFFSIIIAILILIQTILIFKFATDLLIPTPETKKQYTTITYDFNQDNQQETYLVVGSYNNDFVAMKIEQAIIDGKNIALDKQVDINNAIIEVKYGEYNIINTNNDMIFKDININEIIVK